MSSCVVAVEHNTQNDDSCKGVLSIDCGQWEASSTWEKLTISGIFGNKHALPSVPRTRLGMGMMQF